jgi:hypothetical protein
MINSILYNIILNNSKYKVKSIKDIIIFKLGMPDQTINLWIFLAFTY